MGTQGQEKRCGSAQSSNPTSLPYQGQATGQVSLFPKEGRVEGDGRAVQSDADDDGHASATHHSAAQDDARPRDQEGDGGNAGQDERAERTGDVGDDPQPVRGRRPGPQEENRRGSFKYS